MSALDIFRYDGTDVRVVIEDGEPWFVLRDVLATLGIVRRPAAVIERLDEGDVRQAYLTDSLGREQSTYIVSESGLYEVVIRSDAPNAKAFRRWVTHDVLPSIRKTGQYGAAPVAELTRSDLARMILESEAEKAEAIERAEVAETFRHGIESSDGLSIRAWHKHYLPDMSERSLFDLFYSRGLLIDQRGQRQDQFGRPKPGKQHGHPTYAGKAFFYLHPYVDPSGDRFEHTRVRPGQPEVDLAEWVRSHIGKAA